MRFATLIVFFFTFYANGQVIKGVVRDINGTVSDVNVLLLDEQESVLVFTKTTLDGSFVLQLKNLSKPAFLVFRKANYEVKRLDLRELGNTVILQPLQIQMTRAAEVLDEVIVKQSNNYFKKNDTITFRPADYLNGSERVIEDLLKNLPEVTVEENGTIFFKGKPIKKLLLDGDDLFGANYVTGTRNISADLIEKVQGIDHFDDNALLKDIRTSNEVALNLVVKKGKASFSGTAEVNGGLQDFRKINVNGLFVTKPLKYFGIVSSNNIGANNSSFDPNTGTTSLENMRYDDHIVQGPINLGVANNLVDYKRQNINNLFVVGGNLLQKISKHRSIRVNVQYTTDKLYLRSKSQTNATSLNQPILFSEENSSRFDPKIIEAKAFYSDQTKKTFHWENVIVGLANFDRLRNSSSNNDLDQTSRAQSRNFSLINHLNSTWKISNKLAMQSNIIASISEAPQNLHLSPPTEIGLPEMRLASFQDVHFRKKAIVVDTKFLTRFKNTDIQITPTFASASTSLYSELRDNQLQGLGAIYFNNGVFSNTSASIQGNATYRKNQLEIELSHLFSLTYLSFNDFLFSDKNTKILNNPKFQINYFLNTVANLNLSYSFKENAPDENRMFLGSVLTNYRSFIANDFNLQFQKSHNFTIGYSSNDTFNSRRFNTSFAFNYLPNGFFLRTDLSSNLTTSTFFYDELATRNYRLRSAYEFYMHSLRTTFEIENVSAISLDTDYVNNFDARMFTKTNFSFGFTAKRRFFKKIYFENKSNFNQVAIEISGFSNKNSLQTFTNYSKVVWDVRKNLKCIIFNQLLIPDLSNRYKYNFIDFEMSATSHSKRFEYRITANNLANYRTFNNRSVNSFSTSESTFQLLPRVLLAGFVFKF